VASKGLTDAFFGCVANKGVTGAFFVGVAGKGVTGFIGFQFFAALGAAASAS
jgi:hypothetical protein